MTEPIVIELATTERMILEDLTTQFLEVVREQDSDDPAVARLTPNAYPDDDTAAQEFRRLTQTDLLAAREADAAVVLATLAQVPEPDAPSQEYAIAAEDTGAWLRTLAAIRLVMATRLGVTADAPPPDDERTLIYDWLGYRLELLIEATELD